MPTASEHYANLLSGVYSWSVGGAQAQFSALEGWLKQLPLPAPPRNVLDLGCGFGAAAIPLARRGYRVLAVDSSQALLDELAEHAGPLLIQTECRDLLAALQQGSEPIDIAVCLGDTLPHLPSHADVEALLEGLSQRLARDGLAILSYRAPTTLEGAQRFILVRADSSRAHTCFIEQLDERRNTVWDIVHERQDSDTVLRVSSYPKLRLEPQWLSERAAAAGLIVENATSYRGMLVQILRPGAR